MKITITKNDSGQRVDRFLRKTFKNLSFSVIQKVFRSKDVKINGKRAKNAVFLEESDILEVYGSLFNLENDKINNNQDSPTKERSNKNKDFERLILLETDELIFINKPAGEVLHSGTGHKSNTLSDKLIDYLNVSGLSFVPAFAHRLDKDTSGVLVGAKTAEALRTLTKMFSESKVNKKYVALVKGVLEQKSGEIDIPLINKEDKLQDARTSFVLLENIGENSLVDITLHTGRTHQIRKHFLAINHPLVGDRKYGNYTGKQRLFLHSISITFSWNSKLISVISDIPKVFKLEQ